MKKGGGKERSHFQRGKEGRKCVSLLAQKGGGRKRRRIFPSLVQFLDTKKKTHLYLILQEGKRALSACTFDQKSACRAQLHKRLEKKEKKGESLPNRRGIEDLTPYSPARRQDQKRRASSGKKGGEASREPF